jgi:SAM-dependent MidA family methyltransferase
MQTIPLSLPRPSSEALAHSKRLIHFILTQIQENGGMISFEDYMHHALYAPGLGYYHAGTQKFGAEGDFITAPELSPLFSYCIARQYQDICEQLSCDTILEIGAGSGQMASDILNALSKTQCLPKYYYILELSPDLKNRQQQTLKTQCPQHVDRVQWLDSLPKIPFAGLIIANEVLDAMPVSMFKIQFGVLHEKMVILAKHSAFDVHYTPASQTLSSAIEMLYADGIPIFPEGYTSEINLHIRPWIKSLSECFTKGVVLLIDYGFSRQEYYHPDRTMGTLMCHYQHRAHTDPFFYPGLQDITAHVDFTAVAEAASEAELEVLGYTNQAAFLLSCGLLEHVQNPSPKQNQAIHTLTSPAEMGELFKVIALGKNIDASLLGFEISNRLFAL